MPVLIEDTARNTTAAWAGAAISAGTAIGVILSPFTTPPDKPATKPIAGETAQQIKKKNGTVWFDPTSHALWMPNVGNCRHYDRWGLWRKFRGGLDSAAGRHDHLERVFAWQNVLGAPFLAPTVLLNNARGTRSQWALDLAKEALTRQPTAWLSLAGDLDFWCQGSELDAYVGALASLNPAGWVFTVVRPASPYPYTASAEEVFGVCRTVRSLSEDSDVHLSHADLAGLPGVAAGARWVGTGWDLRQRLCTPADFVARPDDQDGGGWFQRPTMERLLGVVTERELQLLAASGMAESLRIGDVPPGPKEVFLHHVQVLSRLVETVSESADYRTRFATLWQIYDEASAYWATASANVRFSAGDEVWVRPYFEGLKLFGRAEGWVP